MGNDILAPVLSFWPAILPAAALLVFLRRVARFVFFALGLLFFLAMSFVPFGSGGLHGEGFLIAFWGLALCAASVLAGIVARIIAFLRQRRQERY